jgi:glucose-6-phosphate dehydrogenase assembly protein OpcA
MATNYKVLGQSIPSAATATTLYTVPASTQSVVSTITVCNQAATAATYRIAIRVAGAALATSQYIAYDVSLPANASDTLTLGITLNATDVITVYSSTATMSFGAFGSEIS